MMRAPEPGEPFVISRRELDAYLREVAETGAVQTCLAINDELLQLIDRIAERRELTPELRVDAHSIRDLDEQWQRDQLAERQHR